MNRRKEVFLTAFLILITGGTLLNWLLSWQTREPASLSAAGSAPKTVTVYVTGYVVKPGAYHLPPQARGIDAVNAAGGLAKGADISGTDLAAPVSDGLQIAIAGDPQMKSIGHQQPASVTAGLGTDTYILTFDKPRWNLGFQNKTADSLLMEYVNSSETVYNWTELVTIQYFKGLHNKVTPDQFAEHLENKIRGQFKQYVSFYIIERNPSSVLQEWNVDQHPVHGSEHTLARILLGREGIFVFQYAAKPTIPLHNKQQWLIILSSVQPAKRI